MCLDGLLGELPLAVEGSALDPHRAAEAAAIAEQQRRRDELTDREGHTQGSRMNSSQGPGTSGNDNIMSYEYRREI